jgi:peroxiredoxin (alkyl hydroperoxide reductase subunit C)
VQAGKPEKKRPGPATGGNRRKNDMSDKGPEGCVAQAKGPILPKAKKSEPESSTQGKEEDTMHVMVGKEAPDFEAAAYFEGGFKNFKLSEFKGKWVFLCFYPGDFTFV